jgi:hypothetical protein
LRPQGEVIRVHLDVQHMQQVPGSARAEDVQSGTSTGTYSDRLHVPIELQRADVLGTALRPLIEAAVDPLRIELAEVRLLSARDQELGHLRAEFEALQADSLEIALPTTRSRRFYG